MAWFVYILLCDQKTFYVGITGNLDRRVVQHKGGYSLSTRKFSEVELVYSEEYNSNREAEKRELQLKGWSVAKKKALILGDRDLLVKLSKSREVGDMIGHES